MRETWLNPNRRAILLGCLPPALMAGIGAWVLWAFPTSTESPWRAIAWLAALAGPAVVAVMLIQLRRPRIAFHNGSVLFYLRGGPPIAVPVQVVEAFFAGQGPAHLPIVSKQPQSVNLVARLSRRAPELAEQQVKPALGNWSDGYVTIRGSWCQPITTELIRTLNRRLKEVKDDNR
jgi:hypothetical protein